MVKIKKYQILILLLFVVSCKTAKTLVDISCPTYRNVEFIRDEISKQGICVLPVLGNNENELFRRSVSEAISVNMKQEFDSHMVKTPSEFISVLNSDNLSSDYSNSINNYISSGVVPKEFVNKIGKSLSVKYFLYTRLISNYDIGSIDNGKYSYPIKIDDIYMQSQVWDSEIGDVVWEGKIGIAKLASDTCDLIEYSAKSLSKVLGKDKNDGPCEKKYSLVQSVDSTNRKTYMITGIIGGVFSILLIVLKL